MVPNSLVEFHPMSTLTELPDIEALLSRWHTGDDKAMAELSQLVYKKLHQLASRYMYHERGNHTLQPTALVNEAFINLLETKISCHDQLHFYRLAGTMMRRILIDHARSKHTAKRGEGQQRVSLTEFAPDTEDPVDIIALHNAMTALADFDADKAQILELQFFAGLSTGQIARLYGVSSKTIERASKLAKAWLYQAM